MKYLICGLLLGCSAASTPTLETMDASEEYVYPSFTSVCQLDNGLGVECSNLTPNTWAWSWMSASDQGLQSYYCNVRACPSNKPCTVEDEGRLLQGVCE